MKLDKYLKDNLYKIIIFLISYIVILLIFFAFKVRNDVIISVSFVLLTGFILSLSFSYLRKRKFYNNLLSNINKLDKAYLVLETLTKPEFYEGELLYQALYDINKSMNENINIIKERTQDFKEYIEMWIHEVKIPLATLTLMSENNKDIFDKKARKELKRLENYVNQVLYYARSENAEKDYLIKETDLSKVIKNVGLDNMETLLENKVEYVVDKVNVKVLTDSKWLEFIINQIVNNSIKYKSDIKNSYIKISTKTNKDITYLYIEDNGIGIKEADLKQVFNKSFTGVNGRKTSKSTGMGLYIAKNMCNKLGHKIAIESKENEYTRVIITFYNNNFYDVLR